MGASEFRCLFRAPADGYDRGMLGISLDRASRRPLAVQLAEALRERMMDGSLRAGTRLPSSRALAEELEAARGVVVEAYEQLESEGYLESRRGIGAFVAAGLELRAERVGGHGPAETRRPARNAAAVRETAWPRWDFTPGIPELASFPRRAWARAVADACAFGADRDFSYGSAAGDPRLRAALSEYLFRLRGLRVEPDRLFLTAGTSSALQTLALYFRTSRFHFEDPGLPFAREAFAAAGAAVVPLEVDEEGAVPPARFAVPPARFAGAERPDLVYLTPSHQFPTGSLMSIARRLEFVRKAEEGGALLLEDDYDAEFRFRGRPVPPLASFAADSTVYLGSFSKTLAPFLRVGWMALPARLTEGWRDFLRRLNLRASAPVQRSLAFLLESGAYERHVAALRRRYRRRRDLLVAALERELSNVLLVGEGHTGFHLMVRLAEGPIREDQRRAIRAAGLAVSYGAEFRYRPRSEERELVLGYGNIRSEAIDEGVRALGRILRA